MRFGMGRVLAVKVILSITILLSLISLLGPIYKLPEVYLFTAFLIYVCIYIVSSFCIIHTMRVSLKFKKRNEELSDQTMSMGRILSGRVNFFRVFRKSPRYNVELALTCQERERNLVFPGTVLNISSDGFMADIPELDCLFDRVIIKITFPLDAESHSIELPAEHLWFTAHGSTYYHGFRFLDFGGDQEQVVFKFLVKFKKQ
jgi:hypothetical protein